MPIYIYVYIYVYLSQPKTPKPQHTSSRFQAGPALLRVQGNPASRRHRHTEVYWAGTSVRAESGEKALLFLGALEKAKAIVDTSTALHMYSIYSTVRPIISRVHCECPELCHRFSRLQY